jgi:hypothetical protein
MPDATLPHLGGWNRFAIEVSDLVATEVSAAPGRGMDPVAVSIATSFDYAVPLDVQVPLIAEAGFTHFSLGANESHSNYLTTDGQGDLKTLAAQHGLAIDTIHGPRADRPDCPAALSRAVTAAAELGVPILVVHGGPFDFPEAELTDRLDQLVRICEGPGLITAGGAACSFECVKSYLRDNAA